MKRAQRTKVSPAKTVLVRNLIHLIQKKDVELQRLHVSKYPPLNLSVGRYKTPKSDDKRSGAYWCVNTPPPIKVRKYQIIWF